MMMGFLRTIARFSISPTSGYNKNLQLVEGTGEASSATCPRNTGCETHRIVCSFDRRGLIDDLSALASAVLSFSHLLSGLHFGGLGAFVAVFWGIQIT